MLFLRLEENPSVPDDRSLFIIPNPLTVFFS
jgi:hypothetical protein